ncbi:uncharacterized protein LOC123566140 [Mercenaria mercenaria]|uniref:uncharacterized protein LOC123566140 n=1 Tax=Mercenaria mercenaria TaxID=6596 RepID=UPI00234F07A6|nr:uncharacterized protein LOC123566140 [Mercenaria mercenaria]
MQMCLSEFLHSLDFLGARKSGDYVGTKLDNPAMILEEHIPTWTRRTSLEDLQECFRIFEEKVCVPEFPARYSPQFWLAHAALTTVYNVMSVYLETHFDDDLKQEMDRLLFDLWIHLLTSGPGSTHLEMMDIILKYPHYPLWKYMQTLHGEDLQLLVSTLKTDFVYKEEVSADHYATLMETHIDKIFKVILSSSQIEEARRGLLDLYAFYLTKMNHVPPHIGPRLSHLCFLICQRYELENPYMGYDDWVLLRNHLKVIKDIVTDPSFTVASEAQYRAPLTLEKIFQAAVQDKILNIMFKDFMSLLLTICNHGNSKKCKRLFLAYQTGLFEQLDFKKGFEETPNWMFDQCVDTLVRLSKTVNMETHIDEFIISAQNLCLLKFTTLSGAQVSLWHELIVNYIVSGRTLLVRESRNLLNSPLLKENNVLNWKKYENQGRLFIDIITDTPGQFMQAGEGGNMFEVIQEYVRFLELLLSQISELEVEGRVRQNVHKCLLKCMEKETPLKAPLSLACIDSGIPDFTDVNFIKDVLFSVDTLLKDETCVGNDATLTKVVLHLLESSLQLHRCKGYIPVDINSLLMSICISCLSVDVTSQDEIGDVTKSCDMWTDLYEKVVLEFVDMHMDKGSIRSVASLVPQVILAIQESIQRSGTSPVRCVNFLSMLGTRCFQLVSDHMTELLELFLDWQCYKLSDFLIVAYQHEPVPFLAMFQDIFSKTLSVEHEDRHHGMIIVEEISKSNSQLFVSSHICQLLGTYPTETDITKQHILNILHNVVMWSPGQIAGYFTVLIDDSKFTPDSLTQRAPILQGLTHYSEDLSQKILDYLTKHADNKSESVSLVAMETLVPLIKDKPGYIHRQKARFKNIWKVSKNERVKQLCVQLLPEIKATIKKPTQNTTQTAVKKEAKKVVPPVSMNTRFSGKVQARPQTSDRNIKPADSLVTRSDTGSSMAAKANLPELDTDTQTSIRLKSNTSDDRSPANVVVTANTENITETNVVGDFVEPEKSKSKGAGDQVLNVTKRENTESKKTGDIGKNLSQSESNVTRESDSGNRNIGDVKHKLEDKLEKSDINRPEEMDESRSENVENVEGQLPEVTKTEQGSYSNIQVHTGKNTEHEKGRDVNTLLEVYAVSDTDSKLLKQYVRTEPSVCLCSCVKMKHLIERLSVKLKHAGYDNIVTNTDTEKIGSMFTGAKVVVVCLEEFEEASDKKLLDEISHLVDKDIPVIVLKFVSAPLSEEVQTGVMGDRSYIRLYSKPGEDRIAGTDWPKYKFCEILMQLSYLGITPDENSITHEFRSLWGTKSQLSDGQEHILDLSILPDIFISCHWGKLKQVEPLYERLTREKLSCWFGAYQMGGSESLYNRIQQGLQCCRIVLACITNKYHLSEVSERDIRMAKQLDRIVIPLLIGECDWPLTGKVGDLLGNCKPMKLTVTTNGCVDASSFGMSKLVTQLQHCLSENNGNDSLDDGGKSLEIPSKTDRFEEKFERNSDFKYADIQDQGLSANKTVKKTSSAYEIGSHPLIKSGMTRRYSNIDDLKVKRRDLPDGVYVDEHGYTLKSSRSKSCIIL